MILVARLSMMLLLVCSGVGIMGVIAWLMKNIEFGR